MRTIVWGIALLLLLFLQTGILMPLGISPVNLILVMVALSVVLSDFDRGLVTAVMGGLILDLGSGLNAGIISLAMFAVFLVIYFAFAELFTRESNIFVFVGSVVATTIGFYAFVLAISAFLNFLGLSAALSNRHIITSQLPLEILWNLLFTFPLYKLYIYIQNFASKIRKNEEPIRS